MRFLDSSSQILLFLVALVYSVYQVHNAMNAFENQETEAMEAMRNAMFRITKLHPKVAYFYAETWTPVLPNTPQKYSDVKKTLLILSNKPGHGAQPRVVAEMFLDPRRRKKATDFEKKKKKRQRKPDHKHFAFLVFKVYEAEYAAVGEELIELGYVYRIVNMYQNYYDSLPSGDALAQDNEESSEDIVSDELEESIGAESDNTLDINIESESDCMPEHGESCSADA